MIRRPRAAAILALGLVAAGLVAQLWRPLAPDVGPVATTLDAFDADVRAAVAAFRAPLPWARAGAMLLELGAAAALALSRPGRALVARLAGPAEVTTGRLAVRAALVAAVGWALIVAAVLPLRWLVGYVHAGVHGLRTASAATWWGTTLTTVALEVLLAAGLAGLVAVLVRRRPDTWHWHLVWAGTLAGAVVVLAWPLVVAPLLRPHTPLPDGPAAAAIEDVLAAAGMDDVRVVVAEESGRSTLVNAQVVGIGPSRTVIVWDTLLELPPEQVGLVVAHELAHREAADLERGALAAGLALLPLALLLRRGMRDRRVRDVLGARSPGDARLVAGGLLLVVAFRVVADPAALWQSRRVEAAADQAALELTGEPAAMIAFHREVVVRNLAAIDRPGWETLLFATHPDATARIERAVAFARDRGLPLPAVDALPGAPGGQTAEGGGDPDATAASSPASRSTMTSQS